MQLVLPDSQSKHEDQERETRQTLQDLQNLHHALQQGKRLFLCPGFLPPPRDLMVWNQLRSVSWKTESYQ